MSDSTSTVRASSWWRGRTSSRTAFRGAAPTCLSDQLRRAVASIPLNIAEGAGEFAPADKARFYRMARRSATETAAVLDVLAVFGLADAQRLVAVRALLLRITAMLTATVLKLGSSSSGSGSGSGSGST